MIKYYKQPMIAFDEDGKTGFRPKHICCPTIGYKADGTECISPVVKPEIADILDTDIECVEVLEVDLPDEVVNLTEETKSIYP